MRVGASTVHQEAPEGRLIAVDAKGERTKPRIAKSAPGGVTSNDWWSSLIYAQDTDSPESLPLYAHPLVVQTHKNGYGVSYPDRAIVKGREYMFRHDEDFVVGVKGLSARNLEVTGHSDFDVRVRLGDEASGLNAVLGHGLPYLQLKRLSDAPASIVFSAERPVRIVLIRDGLALFKSGTRNYAAFAPDGTWKDTGKGLSSDLGGRKHFAVAALPNTEADTVRLFEKHAFAFISGTQVSWTTGGGTVTSTFGATTELVEPCDAPPSKGATGCNRSDQPLFALYPHQWAHSQTALLQGLTYASPRGPMKLAAGEFETELAVQGLLPILPLAPGQESNLKGWLKKEASENFFPLGLGENPDYDAYWDGKSLGRVSTLALIADSLGEDSIRDRLVEALAERLEDWFDGKAPRYFYYDKTWRSLMAFPDSYGSASHLNDHHFHYGYFIHAAATVAQFRPAWTEKQGAMVEMLIRDVAAPRADDKLFPRLRHMDPYAGHSWANGPAQFFEGNNEESSSEDINFSYALALWGALTGNKEYESLGLYLYATQASAVQEYWFDTEHRVFPKSFEHPTVAMVWGAGGKYDTWFDQDPGIIHGINFLPFTGGSLYLGQHPDYVQENFKTIVDRSYGEITTWRDPILMFAALGNPDDALKRYKSDSLFKPEFGASRTMTRLWLTSLAEFGLPEFEKNPGSPYAITFKKGDVKTRVTFNPNTRKTAISAAN